MTQFLDDFRAALVNVPQGGTGGVTTDQLDAVKATVTDLANKLANNDAGDATNAALVTDLETAVTELVAKLTPPTVPVAPTV